MWILAAYIDRMNKAGFYEKARIDFCQAAVSGNKTLAGKMRMGTQSNIERNL